MESRPPIEVPQPRSALEPPVQIPLTVLPPHPCPYLPDRSATYRALLARSMPDNLYRGLMDVGFRRSGRLLYQPVCEGCRECVQLRVPVATFKPSTSQRRSKRLNADLIVTTDEPTPDDEKFALYQKYQREWHQSADRPADDSRDAFESFLYDSPVQTVEFSYRTPDGRLVAVGICDVDAMSVSSVYFYFDPAEAGRGLGTYGAVIELQWALETGRFWYYLGFRVSGCAAMSYKSRFRPHELLSSDGHWYDPDVARSVNATELNGR